jgi:hypothetical protein
MIGMLAHRARKRDFLNENYTLQKRYEEKEKKLCIPFSKETAKSLILT